MHLVIRIHLIASGRGTDRLLSDDIVSTLADMDGRSWPEFHNRWLITQARLARLLRPFAVEARTVRIGEARAKGYPLEDFSDAFARYLPAESVTT